MEIINTIHLELSQIAHFLSLNIVFFILKLLAFTLLFILIRPAIQKLTGVGNKFNNFLDLILKWLYTYFVFVYLFKSIIEAYQYAPILSVIFALVFLFVVIIPVTIHFLSFVKFLSLIINKFFQIGDLLRIDNHIGRIRKITFFNAQLYKEDGNTVIIPLKTFFKVPVKVIHSRNFSLFERSYSLQKNYNSDELLKMAQFKLKNLPYDMDLENMKVKINDGKLIVKIKFGPSYISGIFSESVDKLVTNVFNELDTKA